MKDYDLLVIGAGWAGFNAALEAKKHGLKVGLIEKSQIGGTCLNQGCIPTKSLIQSAKTFALIQKAGTFGIETSNPHLNFLKAQERKDAVIQQLRQGMESRLKDIDLYKSEARLLSADTIIAGQEQIKAKSIILATGSKPVELAKMKFDGRKIISSEQILNLKQIPGKLLIIGAGVIGCEFAGLFSILGSTVTIAEKMPQLLPSEDKEVAKRLAAIFKKKGIKVLTAFDSASLNPDDYDLTLVCVGRTPRIENLGLEKTGIKLESGKIVIDQFAKTSCNNIYAAGDCTGKIMLAHFAAYQGTAAAGNISQPDCPKPLIDTNIPSCVFTDPEISSVGLSQEKAEAKNLDIKVCRFDFLRSGMARILNEADGFLKIICDKRTETILGSVIMGPRASELISILTIALQCKLKISQIRDTVLPHPSLSESLTDALKENYGI
ncbi:dihydrolipoyl dehydrogenase [bacterium]|nr:MAG: dihydrolipoyl dehydrogenase [bacterium]